MFKTTVMVTCIHNRCVDGVTTEEVTTSAMDVVRLLDDEVSEVVSGIVTRNPSYNLCPYVRDMITGFQWATTELYYNGKIYTPTYHRRMNMLDRGREALRCRYTVEELET